MPWAGRATAGASGDSGWGGSGSGAASRHMLAPTVWATSWNTDLSKLSQPEGNLEGGDRSSHWQESAPRETDHPLSWQGHALEVWLHAQSALLGSAPGLQVGRAQMLQPGLGRTFPVVIFRSSKGVWRERQCREVSAIGGNFMPSSQLL